MFSTVDGLPVWLTAAVCVPGCGRILGAKFKLGTLVAGAGIPRPGDRSGSGVRREAGDGSGKDIGAAGFCEGEMCSFPLPGVGAMWLGTRGG